MVQVYQQWQVAESARADVQMILASASARRFRKPQPFLGALEVPLGKSFLVFKGGSLNTDWE